MIYLLRADLPTNDAVEPAFIGSPKRPLCLDCAPSTFLRPGVALSPRGVGGDVPCDVFMDRTHEDAARPAVAVGNERAGAQQLVHPRNSHREHEGSFTRPHGERCD